MNASQFAASLTADVCDAPDADDASLAVGRHLCLDVQAPKVSMRESSYASQVLYKKELLIGLLLHSEALLLFTMLLFLTSQQTSPVVSALSC
jgi:hypothetical protein